MGEDEEVAAFRRDELTRRRRWAIRQGLWAELQVHEVETFHELAARLGTEPALRYLEDLGYRHTAREDWADLEADLIVWMQNRGLRPDFLSATEPTMPTVTEAEAEEGRAALRRMNQRLAGVLRPRNDPRAWRNPEFARVYAEVWGLTLPGEAEIAYQAGAVRAIHPRSGAGGAGK